MTSLNAARELSPTSDLLWAATGQSPDDVAALLRASRSPGRVRKIADELKDAWRKARWHSPGTTVNLPDGFWTLVAAHARHLDPDLLYSVAQHFGASEAFLDRPLESLSPNTRGHATLLGLEVLRRYEELPVWSRDVVAMFASLHLEREAVAGVVTFSGREGQDLVRTWSLAGQELSGRRLHLAAILSAAPDTPADFLFEIEEEVGPALSKHAAGPLRDDTASRALRNLLRHPNTDQVLRGLLFQQTFGDEDAQEILFQQAESRQCPLLQAECLRHLRNAKESPLSRFTLVRLLPDASSELREVCWKHLLATSDGRQLVLRLLRGDAPENPLLDLLRTHPEAVLGSEDAEIRQAAVIAISNHTSGTQDCSRERQEQGVQARRMARG